MPTPFEAGKTAKELGIDTSRKFVVVSNGKGEIFRTGDIVKMSGSAPFAIEPGATFQNKQGDKEIMFWRELAYADDVADPVHEEEAYQPRVGDRVSLEAEIVSVYATDRPRCDVKLLLPNITLITVPVEDLARAKLLFRAPRTLTKSEAEALLTEKLGESVRIE